ncbi:RNA 2',3'-cyclic phosphodiesterase [Paraferrimonas sedimenticola]|uniref:RNA 2',3'-cyclic phosphodiesterase n=1 Tax=Paraferrimonas sedimenticola TaxID=375674 RepID=A0AA37RUL5_9GAMM|nr:RNA 2',3'-cyclic phosphodiesterase [Paraferrimonas sedimenticola]GLP95626.1 RNA 2',3'-cyclic phosphodiesterase [Paraferrimonas sedimenticola]
MNRLFAAIKVNSTASQQICQLQSGFGRDGRIIPKDNLHITLAFFGLTREAVQLELVEAIQAVPKRKFSLCFDTLSIWPNSRLRCLETSQCPQALAELARDLRGLSARYGLHQSLHPYRPHISLQRNLPQTTGQWQTSCALAQPIIIWPSHFQLFRSQLGPSGPHYQPIASWSLHKDG